MNDGLAISWKGAIVAYLKTLSGYLPGRNEENCKGPQSGRLVSPSNIPGGSISNTS
jgi:hypothetical protein